MVRVIVIGAGPAGITAAREAAILGAGVTLIEADHLGGRAAWHSLIPSKVLIEAAERVHRSQKYAILGLKGQPPVAELEALHERIQKTAVNWSERQREMLERVRVHVRRGVAQFVDARHLLISTPNQPAEVIDFDAVVIAAGSEPTFVPGFVPDGQRILDPRMMRNICEWPERIVMVGGGVTGAEYSAFFNNLGIPVSWITDLNTILPRSDDDVSDMLVKQMTARGVELLTKAPVDGIEARETGVRVILRSGRVITGSHAFIAIGRQPDITRLNLEAAGVAVNRMGIEVDGYGRTSQPDIYAVGNVCGPPFTVNRGQAQAVVAVRHALKRPVQPVREDILVEAIYSEPQVAQVGLTEGAAWAAGQAVRTVRRTYAQVLKPVIAEETEGFIKLLIEPNNRRILGGAAVGSHAVELINLVSLAVMQGLSLDLLTGWFPAYPSLAELVSEMAAGACEDHTTVY